jgi:hypothetical protein
MNLQNSLKCLLASAVAIGWAIPADAQVVVTEATGTIQSFEGGAFGNGGGGAYLGQPVTIDFSYDASTVSGSIINTDWIQTAPLTSALIVGGVFGSGINLEPGGPGAGSITDDLNLTANSLTVTVVSDLVPPTPDFTGDLYGLSYFSDGTNTTLKLIQDTFANGNLDSQSSGAANLSNVSVTQVAQAPEIDPASAVSALTLLMGGIAVIRGRKFGAMKLT